MTGTVGALAAAMAAFLLGHFALARRVTRDAIVARIGEVGFTVGYSLIAIVTFLWAIAAYNAAPVVPIWTPPVGLQHLSLLIMLLAFIFLVAGYLTPNPMAVGLDSRPMVEKPASGIQAITRHPVMWAVALWGISHLLANGTAADIIFFGGLTALALLGALHIDIKRARRFGDLWPGYAAQTSYVPFAAIIAGRNRFSLAALGWWRIGLGIAAYAIFLAIHAWLFGVSPLPL